MLTPSQAVPPKHLERGVAVFFIQRGIEFPRSVHLTGIESPGLISAFAIPEYLGTYGTNPNSTCARNTFLNLTPPGRLEMLISTNQPKGDTPETDTYVYRPR